EPARVHVSVYREGGGCRKGRTLGITAGTSLPPPAQAESFALPSSARLAGVHRLPELTLRPRSRDPSASNPSPGPRASVPFPARPVAPCLLTNPLRASSAGSGFQPLDSAANSSGRTGD